ncbi:transcriptional modulator of MazE/toxin, MazF [Syntrophothermus lipocalidus DSM 12680]|uniref:mRNA interferase n=1 Tax=Syntrophothermus lipocalidus (strain DSM 12680 / TGB-C1) TaxID=643648 RepID=D7CPA2_SYNLT|nr:transcriptional modulator of MazE/toxin, MazF [Syntrophothermus lipocalidus DSM 12680]
MFRKVNNGVMGLTIKRGEVYFAQLNPVVGSEQGGIRPVLVVQNDIGNQYSPTTIVLAITSQINKAKLPTHVELRAAKYGLDKDSVILGEQIRTIDKTRLKQRIAFLDEETMAKVNHALEISLGLVDA